MMELNKKQVGALLKVIYRDNDRPAIQCLTVQKYKDRAVAVATNGYILSALYLDEDEAKGLVSLKLRRETLEKWYKLADSKSRLDTKELADLYGEDYSQNGGHLDVAYPDWTKVVPEGEQQTGRIAFNADYAKILQDLAGTDGLEYTLNSRLGAMVARTEGGVYVLMPKK